MKGAVELLKIRPNLVLVTICLVCFSCSLQKQSVNANNQQPSANLQGIVGDKTSSEEWKRYELDGGKGDSISVLLPAKPEDFPGMNFKAPPDLVLPAHLYMQSKDATDCFAVFVDLPKESDAMLSKQRGDVFYGCWRGVAGSVQGILQRRFGGSFDITPSDQLTKIEDNRERRVQDFTIGSQTGRAQVIFAGRRAYMLVSIWNPADSKSESYASQFLDSFQVKIEQK